MVMAFELSARLGHCPWEDAARVRRHLAAIGLPTSLDADGGRVWNAAAVIEHMGRDKKVKGGRITFVLTRGIGQAFLCNDVDLTEVEALLTAA
jgi:3-dehydroquinate synthase